LIPPDDLKRILASLGLLSRSGVIVIQDLHGRRVVVNISKI